MKLNELSPVKRAAIAALESVKHMVMTDCSDEDVAKAMVKFHPSSDKDYFNPDDYMNYDEACKELRLGNNRGKLNSLCKRYGIKNISVKNRPLGFRRKEILKLKNILYK